MVLMAFLMAIGVSDQGRLFWDDFELGITIAWGELRDECAAVGYVPGCQASTNTSTWLWQIPKEDCVYREISPGQQRCFPPLFLAALEQSSQGIWVGVTARSSYGEDSACYLFQLDGHHVGPGPPLPLRCVNAKLHRIFVSGFESGDTKEWTR